MESTRIEVRMKNTGPLQDVMLKACPMSEDGTVSIALLAKAIGVTPASLHQSIRKGRLSAKLAHRILGLPGNLVTREDLLPFLLGPDK